MGFALAGDLGWRGIGTMPVERTDCAITRPKMDLIGPRTMEFCRRWGLEQAVRDCPCNPDHPQDNVWLESLTGFEFGRAPFPSPRDERPPPQSPVKGERCPQDMFDPILRRRVDSLADVTLHYRTETRLVLVRPDGFAAWRGDSLPDDPLVLIDTVRGEPARADAPTRGKRSVHAAV